MPQLPSTLPPIGLKEIAPRYVNGQFQTNWFVAQFPFNKQLIEEVKSIPGARWVKDAKHWEIPQHAIPVLDYRQIRYSILSRAMKAAPAPPLDVLMARLRPYQQQDVLTMLANPGFILAYDMRVGKTPTASVGIASVLASGRARTAVVLYPNVVRKEWERQFPMFTNGLPFVAVDGTREFDGSQFEVSKYPYLCIGMHYELLRSASDRDEEGNFEMNPIVREVLNLVYRRGPSIAVADEPHLIVNRKSPRAQIFVRIGAMANQRWCLDGTPLRSRPRDMFPIWQFLSIDSMGSYSKYTGRYANGHMGDHGWVDKGKSNEDELKWRLHSLWIQRSRRDVAPWLPKTERTIFLCDMTKSEYEAYAAREIALGQDALAELNEDGTPRSLAALKQLAESVAVSKMPRMLERVRHHAENRQVKVLVFAYQHETLQRAWATLKDASEVKADPFKIPFHIAGGWMVPEKRHVEIQSWKAQRGPAVLLVNSMSSGIGIDLADADVAIGLEASWIPADFMQMEARIEDVHQGKRKSPPLLEYLLARNTIDEDMVSKLITKLNAVESITGVNAVSSEMQQVLRNAGVVDRSVLTLANEDPETVESALDSLRARLAKSGDSALYDRGDNEDVDLDEEDDEDEPEDENDGD